ncbi:hypothetical protein HDV03_004318 [Kappamyces sp. JEL0829]|nr:hypothetical protein HDV03_004318 [Kappamyces sp. JEL0829]
MEESAPSPKRRRGSVLEGAATAGGAGEVDGGGSTPMDMDEPAATPDSSVVDSQHAASPAISKPTTLKEGSLSYHDAIKAQEAARRAGNYGGMSSTLASANPRKAPEIKMKMAHGPTRK